MILQIAVESYQAVSLKWYKQKPRGAETGMTTDSDLLGDCCSTFYN